MRKKGIVVSDPHCGHRTGLTMPAFWQGEMLELQKLCWEWFAEKHKEEGPFDFACFAGDLIEGKMTRNGGVELIETSLIRQADMATELVNYIGAERNYFCYGTPYHTSEGGEDYEDLIAREAKNGVIKDQVILDIDGVIINMRHHVGGSSMPFNWTALSKEKISDILWADAFGRENANIILRGHVHRHHFQGGVEASGDQWVAMTLPCLQLWTHFGGRRITSPPITYGFTVIEINNGEFSWKTHTMSLKGLQEVIRY